MSDTGIIVYSRSGHSKRLADRLGRELNADVVEIAAPRYASAVIGYARAGFDSIRQNTSRHELQLASLSGFDRVVLCGPVWTSYPAVPLRALLRSDAGFPRVVGLFLTCGAQSAPGQAFAAAATDLGRPLAATAVLPNSAEDTDQEDAVIADFIRDLEPGRLSLVRD